MKTGTELVDSISRAFRDYFDNGLKFILKDGAFVIEGTQPTINRFENPTEEVKAKNWFDDIWIYIKIKQIWGDEKKKVSYPTISISFFHETAPNCLDQLFRAEWDSYENISTTQHPQPHWHITSNLAVEKSLEDLKGDENDIEDPFRMFADLVAEEKKSLLNIHTMHFAMAGKWHKTGNYINDMGDAETIINWMKHLFTHVRAEIEYMKKRI